MDGIKRIKQLAADIKDEALLEIINYLVSREDMNEKYLSEEKSLKQMVNFIRNKAKELAKDNMAMVKDDVVFGWAIHYFDETNEQLGLIGTKTSNEENEIDEQEDNKKVIEPKKTNYVSEGQLSLF